MIFSDRNKDHRQPRFLPIMKLLAKAPFFLPLLLDEAMHRAMNRTADDMSGACKCSRKMVGMAVFGLSSTVFASLTFVLGSQAFSIYIFCLSLFSLLIFSKYSKEAFERKEKPGVAHSGYISDFINKAMRLCLFVNMLIQFACFFVKSQGESNNIFSHMKYFSIFTFGYYFVFCLITPNNDYFGKVKKIFDGIALALSLKHGVSLNY